MKKGILRYFVFFCFAFFHSVQLSIPNGHSKQVGLQFWKQGNAIDACDKRQCNHSCRQHSL